jgi:putative transposase
MTGLQIQKELDYAYYVLIRDLCRGHLFYEEADYHEFLTLIKKYHDIFGCKLHAYALLQDHGYLLVSVSEFVIISRTLKAISQQFSEYFKIKYRRVLRVLDLQFSIEMVDPFTKVLTYYRYVELAPVRSKIVDHPADYPWTSYGCNAMGEDLGMITPHPSYKSLGRDNQSRWKTYREKFAQKKLPSVML